MSEQRRQYDPPLFMFSHWEYLEPLRTHRSFVVVFAASAILCALALTYVYAEKYEASVTLVFTAGEVTRLQFRGSTSEAFGAPLPQTDFKVIGKTLEALAQSERLLREIVEQFDLDAPEKRVYEGPWYIRYYKMAKDYGKEYALNAWAFLKYGRVPDEDLTAEAAARLGNEVEIRSADSYVFELRVRDSHPARVAAIADAIAKTLVAMANEADTGPAADRRRELEALQVTKLREIDSYQRRINDLLSQNEVTSVSLELEEGVDELYALQAEQTRLKAEIEQGARKVKSFSDKLASAEQLPRGSGARNPGQSGRRRLQSEDIRKVISDKLFTEIELDGLRARSAALEASIHELNARLKQLPGLKLQIDQLENDLARANREYELVNISLSELVLQESENVAEFKIQHVAAVPTAPVTPIKVYHVGLAAILGISLAVGLVYVFTYFNVRIFIPTRGAKHRAAQPEARQPSLQEDGTEALTEGTETELSFQDVETSSQLADELVQAPKVER